MTYTVPSGEPDVLHPSTEWEWNVDYVDFPPDEAWKLRYHVNGAEGQTIAIDAAANAENDGYEVREGADAHRDVAAGLYALVGYVWKDPAGGGGFDAATERHLVYRDSLLIREDASKVVPSLSHDEKMLALFDAALESRIPDDLQFVQIGSRSISAIPLQELVRLQGVYRARVRAARGGGQPIRAGRFVIRG